MPRRWIRPAYAVSLSSQGDGAPKSANLWLRARCRDTAGASRRANMRSSSASVSANKSTCGVSGIGPRFSLRPDRLPPQTSASSWQGLIVVPGGAPMPPECPLARRPAGAAPRPANAYASRKRPSEGRGGSIVSEVWRAGISCKNQCRERAWKSPQRPRTGRIDPSARPSSS